MAEVNHPVAVTWRAYLEARGPVLAGKLRKVAPGWKSWKKRARAVAR
jgi:hypothetical protein